MIEMRTVSEVPDMQTAHNVSARKLHDSEHAQIVHLALRPGEALKKHITPVDVCFFVLEGRGVVEIGEDRAEAAAGTLIESPQGIPHRWRNESDQPLRVLVIKTPRPTAQTRIL